MNAPLAIAQATKFFKKTPRSHMTRMDLIQVAMEGLTAGVDKYSGPYMPDLYPQVLIGRINSTEENPPVVRQPRGQRRAS